MKRTGLLLSGCAAVCLLVQQVCAQNPPTAAGWPEVAPEARLWNTYPLDQVVHKAWVAPERQLQGLRIVAPIGGTGTAQVVATQRGGVKALAASVKAPEGWPADSVIVRFQTLADDKVPQWQWGPGQAMRRVKLPDGANERLPSYLPVLAEKAPAAPVVPIRVIARVPRDAKAGVATATLSISIDGRREDLAVDIECGPFVMPRPRDARVHVDIYQSPEAVARMYKVPLWSKEHWTLVEQSVRLIGEYPSHVLWVPLIAGKGNLASGAIQDHLQESMLRYNREGDDWKVDASRLETYLDMYAKHVGEPASLMCFAWGSSATDVHARRGTEGDLAKVSFPVTGFDGQPIIVKGFTPDAKALYAAAFTAVRKAVDRQKWKQECVHIGLAMDTIPSKFYVDFLKEPSGNAPWVKHAHDQQRDFYGVKVAYASTARSQADWDGPFYKNPRIVVDYPYDEGPSSGLLRCYSAVNTSLRGRMRGISGPLADFWTGTLWVGGQPTMMSYGQYIFYPGPKGAEHSTQSLILLEAAQAAEAAWRCAAAGDTTADAWLRWGAGSTTRGDWIGQERAMKPERLPDLQAALFKAANGK